MPRLAAIEKRLEERERRQFRAAVAFGVAVAVLVIGVAFSIWSNIEQDEQIRSVSACATNPESRECRRGHAHSVALTTHAEACFILAKAGYRCASRPLPEAEELRRRLAAEADAPPESPLSYRALPNPDARGAAASPPAASDEPENSAVALPRLPAPAAPSPPASKPPAQPRPEPPAPPAPAPPSPPPAAPPRPLLDLPGDLGVCVSALGIRVAC